MTRLLGTTVCACYNSLYFILYLFYATIKLQLLFQTPIPTE